MYILNTLNIGKEYNKLTDDMKVKEMKSTKDLGLGDSFYGGNVNNVIFLKDSPIILLVDTTRDGIQVKDTAIEKLEDLGYDELKELATQKKVDFKPVGTKKEELAKMVGDKCLEVALVLN